MDNHTPRNPKRPNGGVGGREDCWSEGATETLIEAWGDRYLRLNRGNLRQKDWKEVADAVNSRRSPIKPPRTDVQCKNRIDTLKKKYKVEKSKPSTSNWPFYFRLDQLIGPNALTPPYNKKKRLKPTPVNFTVKPNPNAVVVYSAGSSSKSKLNSSGSNGSSMDGGGGGRDDDVLFGGGDGGMRKNRMEYVGFSEEEACKELARAVLRFGEIYERIESSKQKQMMELEKQRMEFTKDLELQRMNVFMEAQLELEKLNRMTEGAPSAGKK